MALKSNQTPEVRLKAEKRLGFVRIDVGSIFSSKSSFKVQTKTVYRKCFQGDLNGITSDLGSGNKKVGIMTIEVLGSKKIRPIVKRFSSNDLIAGLDLNFDVPKPFHKKPLGIFICKDTAKTGSCQGGKEVVDMNVILENYLNPAAVDPKFAKKDRVYVFQQAILNDGVLLLQGNPKKKKKYYKNLIRYSKKFLKNKGAFAKNIKMIRRTNEVLLSVPGKAIDGGVNFPMYGMHPDCKPYAVIHAETGEIIYKGPHAAQENEKTEK